MTSSLKNARNPKLIGTDVVNGAPTRVYEFNSTMQVPNGPSVPVTSRVWLAVADGLPRKIESRGSDQGGEFRAVFYDLNEKISIEAPR
jgi:hypothetical protein